LPFVTTEHYEAAPEDTNSPQILDHLIEYPLAVEFAAVSTSVLNTAEALDEFCGDPTAQMVPHVWIEQTTCRLQGGCSTTELMRHGSRRRDYPAK
jgi:hypothetical protein